MIDGLEKMRSPEDIEKEAYNSTGMISLDEMQKLCGEVSPGPWRYWPLTSSRSRDKNGLETEAYVDGLEYVNYDGELKPEDAKFIAAAHTFVPWAIERINELERSVIGQMIDQNKTQENIPIKINFKKVSQYAQTPKRAHDTDAGWDLTCTHSYIDAANTTTIVAHTGIAVDIPSGYVGLLFPRSSIANFSVHMTNCVGVIDSGYHGEIIVKFKELPEIERRLYKADDRIAQLIIMPIPSVEFVQVDEFEASERGSGGFGSTGR